MVNSATGEAASASRPDRLRHGPDRLQLQRGRHARPAAIAQGMGLSAMPLSALRAASAAPCSSALSSRDSAMHSEVVTTRSISDGEDRRPRGARAEQRHQQRHAHEAGVGERRHQRAEGCVVPADARFRLAAITHADQHQRAQQVDAQRRRIQQLRHRRAGAEAIQHAGQREIQHEGVEPRDRIERQHAPPRGHVAAQHQREEGKGDQQDVKHPRILRATTLASDRRAARRRPV